MRDPARKRNFAVLILLGAIAAVALANAFPGPPQSFTWQTVLTVGGATTALFASVVVLLRQIDVARFSRMRRGEGLLANWMVAPAQWEQFRASSRAWDASPELGENLVDLTQSPGKDGIGVAVSDNALLVGRDFHSIEKNADVRIHAGWMEFDTYYSAAEGPSSRHIIQRFPIAPGAESSARRIVDHYTQAYEAAAANPRLKLYLLIGLVGLPLLIALLAWWFQWL